MSEDAANELQAAIVGKLKMTPAVTALIGARIFDHQPASVQFPFVSFGPVQEVPSDYDCIDAAEIIIQIDIWSRAVGKQEASKIATAIERALHDASLTMTDNAFVVITKGIRRIFKAADNLTTQGALRFTAVVEKH